MKDGLNNDIAVGDHVVWVGGKNQYSGVTIRKIAKITPKMVRLVSNSTWNPKALGECVDPGSVVVINRISENVPVEQLK